MLLYGLVYYGRLSTLMACEQAVCHLVLRAPEASCWWWWGNIASFLWESYFNKTGSCFDLV